MTHAATVLAHSISPDGVQLFSLESVFPRCVLAEFNTHRMLSRNSASSRAIPVARMIKMVQEHPYIPSAWGKNQKGMQAVEDILGTDAMRCDATWLHARDLMVGCAEKLLDLGVHKQLTNRLLEPFMWHTVIVTATEWSNFFHLRCHPAAHPDIRKTAELMRRALAESTPREIGYGDWHLPLFDSNAGQGSIRGGVADGDFGVEDAIKISVGRCARVSYLTHEGKRDPEVDIALHDRLLESGHMSPFEHVARPTNNDRPEFRAEDAWFGNFRGWVQYRKTLPNESDILAVRP